MAKQLAIRRFFPSLNLKIFLCLFFCIGLFSYFYLQTEVLSSKPKADELRSWNVALSIKEGIKAYDENFNFFGHTLYYSTQQHAPLACYYYYPYVIAFENNLTVLRMANFIPALLVITLTFFLSLKLYHLSVAFLSTILLILNPGFFELVLRFSEYGAALLISSTLTILLFLKWIASKKSSYLYAAAFFLSFGLGFRNWYFYFIFSFIGVVFIFFKQHFKKDKILFWFAFFFLLGGLPFIFALIKDAGMSYVFKSLFVGEMLPTHNNLNYFLNIKERFFQFLTVLLGGDIYEKDLAYLSTVKWYGILLSIGLFSFFMHLKNCKDNIISRFLLAIVAGMFLFLPLTGRGFTSGHTMILYPYVQIIISAGIIKIIHLNKNKLIQIVRTVVLITLIATSFRVFFNYYDSFFSERTKQEKIATESFLDYLVQINPDEVVFFNANPSIFYEIEPYAKTKGFLNKETEFRNLIFEGNLDFVGEEVLEQFYSKKRNSAIIFSVDNEYDKKIFKSTLELIDKNNFSDVIKKEFWTKYDTGYIVLSMKC